jgi:hypothetical protein
MTAPLRATYGVIAIPSWQLITERFSRAFRFFDLTGAQLAEVGVDYAASSRIPTSYEGVSGGALWKLYIELGGDKVVGVQKKLDGVAFRQSPDNSLVTCNALPSVGALVERIRKKWPAVS